MSEPRPINDRPLTPEEAQAAYDAAPEVPVSDERVKEIVGHATRPRSAFKDWGDGCRSVSYLITYKFESVEAEVSFCFDLPAECFHSRERDGYTTAHMRAFLPAGEPEEQTRARMRDICQRHNVTLELLHGAGSDEWYELVHLAGHGKRWGKPEDLA